MNDFPVVVMPKELSSAVSRLPFTKAIPLMRNYFQSNGIDYSTFGVSFRAWYDDKTGCWCHQNRINPREMKESDALKAGFNSIKLRSMKGYSR